MSFPDFYFLASVFPNVTFRAMNSFDSFCDFINNGNGRSFTYQKRRLSRIFALYQSLNDDFTSSSIAALYKKIKAILPQFYEKKTITEFKNDLHILLSSGLIFAKSDALKNLRDERLKLIRHNEIRSLQEDGDLYKITLEQIIRQIDGSI